MKTIKPSLLVIILLSVMLTSCFTVSPDKNSGHYKYEVACINSEMDGSVTVKAYGLGRSKPDAVLQAEKNALRTVMFQGIRAGNADECSVKPLINNQNLLETRSAYFADFFSDKGRIYEQFVSTTKDERFLSPREKKMASNGQRTWGVVLRIEVEKLRQKLRNDQIIP